MQDTSVPSLSELDMAIHELEPLSELDRAFAGLEAVESGKAGLKVPTDRALSRKSWGPTTAQPAVPAKAGLTRSSTSQLPPVVSKTLPVKITSEVLDKSGQSAPLARKSANGTSQSTNLARVSGVKRGSKVVPNNPVPANQPTTATRLSKTISPSQVQRKSSEKKEVPKTFVPFEEESVELTALEKDLQRLDGSKLTRKSAPDVPTPSPKSFQGQEQQQHERRGIRSMSSPIPPDQTVRHLDLNWRSGPGKQADATILKYFPLVPAKQ
jgi:hypothetical protein